MPRYRINVGLSTFWQTLERAECLIQLAEKTPEYQDPLLGSAIVLLAAGLDQAISFRLKGLAASEEPDMPSVDGAEARRLLESTLWQRIKLAPEVNQPLPFRLSPQSDYVKYLRELVDRRNRLVHLDEEPVDLEWEGPVFPLTEDGRRETAKALRAYAHESQDTLPAIRVNAEWEEVTPAEARRAMLAVRTYLQALFEGDEESEDKLAGPSA